MERIPKGIYTLEFRAEAVKLVEEEGLAVSGHRTGLVLTESGRLGDGPEYAGSAGL